MARKIPYKRMLIKIKIFKELLSIVYRRRKT